MSTLSRVLQRTHELTNIASTQRSDRDRIRSILNGGASGLKALLGDKVSVPYDDLPVANYLHSGLERLAQRIGTSPALKVDPPAHLDSERPKQRAAKRRRIITYYDETSRFELQLPQVGRWLPGYGFCVWVIREGKDVSGNPYPHAELRNPYDCYFSNWGPDQQPRDLAIIRNVARRDLARSYPQYAERILKAEGEKSAGGITSLTSPWRGQWEGNEDGLEVVEFYDDIGTYLVIPELDLVADFMPNPLKSGPRFVVAKRYSFDALQSQYQHTLGLMAQMAKLNVLAVIAAEDATFRETNIIGDLDQAEYQRGRFATNYFTPGTQIERPTGDVAFQVFQQLDRLERHFRITANYSVQEDGQSPLDFATGRGIENLNAAQDSNGAEYQTVLRHAIERLDSKRLEWAEELYGDRKLTISIHSNGETRTESYRPTRDIAGEYDSRRVYGVMAGWDEPSKIVTGLQLLQGEIIDHETFQENVHGLDNIPKVNERIKKKKAEDRLFDILSQTAIDPANPQAPQARAAMREIAKTGDVDRVMEKFFAPDGEEPDPALQAQLAAEQQQGALAGLGGPGGAPPDVATVLSRLTQSGGAEGGVQTVGQL